MSSPPPPAKPAAVVEAERAWQASFTGGPYTALVMVNYLLVAGGKTQADLCKDAKAALKNVTKGPVATKTIDDAQLKVTWAGHTGRCTSFAVKVVNELKKSTLKDATGAAPLFDFEIFDIGRHRVARCRNSGVLIDSSSEHTGGAFVLREGEWFTFPETKASWKYVKDTTAGTTTSKFSRNGKLEAKDVKTSKSSISAIEAMKICLGEMEVIAFKSIPTLFRSIDSAGKGVYHGFILWNLKDKVLELKETTRATVSWRIQWNPASPGTDDDFVKCISEVENFVKVFGGPYGPQQWAADGLSDINLQLMYNATTIWGNPKLIEPAK